MRVSAPMTKNSPDTGPMTGRSTKAELIMMPSQKHAMSTMDACTPVSLNVRTPKVFSRRLTLSRSLRKFLKNVE